MYERWSRFDGRPLTEKAPVRLSRSYDDLRWSLPQCSVAHPYQDDGSDYTYSAVV